jgi:hypothetical protein
LSAHKDSEYLEEAKRTQVEVSPIDGAAVLTMLDRIAQAQSPPDILDQMRKMKGGSKE